MKKQQKLDGTKGSELGIKKNKSRYVDDFTAVDPTVLVGLYHLNLFCRKVRGEVQLILTMEGKYKNRAFGGGNTV